MVSSTANTQTTTAPAAATAAQAAKQPAKPTSFAAIVAAASSSSATAAAPLAVVVKKPAVADKTPENKDSKAAAKADNKATKGKGEGKGKSAAENQAKANAENKGEEARKGASPESKGKSTEAKGKENKSKKAVAAPPSDAVVRVSPASVTEAKGPSFAAIVRATTAAKQSVPITTSPSAAPPVASTKAAASNKPAPAATAAAPTAPTTASATTTTATTNASPSAAAATPAAPSFAAIMKKERQAATVALPPAPSAVAPRVPSPAAAPVAVPVVVTGKALTPFHRLGPDITAHLLGFLWPTDVLRISHLIGFVKQVSNNYHLVERQEIRCFHSRLSFEEDILGVGVSCQYYPDGVLKACISELDLISSVAFDEGVRTSVWGKPFTFFLPLAINAQHANRAFERMKSSFSRIQANLPEAPQFDETKSKSLPRFDPLQAMNVIQSLMNGMVVQLMNAVAEQRLHASEKALLGYCAFHHLLLYLATRYPQIVAHASQAVNKFLTTPTARTKRITPDIGKLLVLLTLTDGSLGWDKLAIVFLKESFARGVRWYSREYPAMLLNTNPLQSGVDQERLDTVFSASQTSLRLAMFQVYFLTTIGRPQGQNPAALLQTYNKSLGRPSESQKVALQKACQSILQVKTWDEFFDRVHVQRPTPLFLSNLLREAVRTSSQLRYHSTEDKDKERGERKHDRDHNRGGERKERGQQDRPRRPRRE